MLQHTATYCNTLQHTAAHCNALQRTTTHCNALQHSTTRCNILQHTAMHRHRCTSARWKKSWHAATHCNTPQHTSTLCNTLQHCAYCNILQRIGTGARLCDIEKVVTHCNTLQHTATHCNTMHHIATHGNKLQHCATHCNILQHTATYRHTCTSTRWKKSWHTATHCNTMQHSATLWHALQRSATHCNTLQHTATHCNTHARVHVCVYKCDGILQKCMTRRNTLQHTATHCNTLQHTVTHCNTLQHTVTHCNTLQHSATHCNTLQHTGTGPCLRDGQRVQLRWNIAKEFASLTHLNPDGPAGSMPWKGRVLLQCIAVCCSVLQWEFVSLTRVNPDGPPGLMHWKGSVLQYVATCCSVGQCGAVRVGESLCCKQVCDYLCAKEFVNLTRVNPDGPPGLMPWKGSVLLQCIAVCCSVLQWEFVSLAYVKSRCPSLVDYSEKGACARYQSVVSHVWCDMFESRHMLQKRDM